MKPPLIYVAGPLGSPDKIGWQLVHENVGRALDVASKLVQAGWSPIVPHQNAYWPNAFEIPHETWLEIDASLLRVCRAIVRLPGESVGADRETTWAAEWGIPLLTLDRALLGPCAELGIKMDVADV